MIARGALILGLILAAAMPVTAQDAGLHADLRQQAEKSLILSRQALLTDAVRMGESGEKDAALHLLDLAALRGPSADQQAAIEKLRSRFSK